VKAGKTAAGYHQYYASIHSNFHLFYL